MTVLTRTELRDQYGATQAEVNKYFKQHPRLPRTKAVIGKIKDRIMASKLVRAPGREASFTQANAEWQMLYGQSRFGGAITFVGTTGTTHQNLHMVITVAGHDIEGIDKLYLDEQEVVFGATPDARWSTGIKRDDGTTATADHKVFMSVTKGEVGQVTNADLHTSLPALWTTNHVQDGCAYVYLIFVWDASLFPNGVPEVTFLGKGKKILPGPAPSSPVYGNNVADVIVNYLTDTRFGMSVPTEQIDTDSWTTARNICDEDVGIIGGSTEKRYTVNGVFKVSETPQEILEAMCTAMGGTITFVNGLWKIYPAAYRTPTITLTEDDILSDIRVQTKLSRKDSFNGVRGTFISPDNHYLETDFPAVKNDYYKTLDNNERVWEDVQFSLTTSSPRAQRLAKIELERNRQAITVQLTASLRAYQVEPPETIMLTIERYGWSAKVFEVQQSTIILEGGGETEPPYIAVELLLRETASAIYDWANGSETAYDIAPNTTLPNPLSVPTISGLALASGTDQLYVRADGTVFSRIKVSWTASDDFFVTSGGFYQVQYKKSADASWITLSDLPGDIVSMFILDVQDGQMYDVRVRAMNALRVVGDWDTYVNYVVIGKTAPPSNVAGLFGSVNGFGIKLTWSSVSDLDVSQYELRFGASSSSWATAEFIDLAGSNSYTMQLQDAGTYRFFVKAKDSSLNYSAIATELLVAITAPEAPVTSIQVNNANYILRWVVPDALFSIDSYEIYQSDSGETFEDSVFVASVRGTLYQDKIDWSGFKAFWVRAIDVAGNDGEPYQVTLSITPPSVVTNLVSQILNQSVLLRWTAPTDHTLPIDHYLVYKGDVFLSATLVGQASGTFSALFEIVGGTYTYWIVPVDSAANIGTESALTVIVQNPTDFVLVETGDPENDTPYINPDTGYGIHFQTDTDNALLMPINEDETWGDHFASHGWSNFNDIISAGYSYFIQPVPASAYWERVIDYGSTIAAALVTLDFSRTDYDGTAAVVTTIAYSADGSTWVSTTGQQAYAASFRYIKIRFQIGTIPGARGTPTGNIGLNYP